MKKDPDRRSRGEIWKSARFALLALIPLVSGPNVETPAPTPPMVERFAGIAVVVESVAPTVVDPEVEEWVEDTLASLDLRGRIAQMVLPWIRGGRIAPGSVEYRRLRRWIEEDGVGGLIVSRGPVGEFAPMMNAVQRMARVPLLIVSDLETGPGMRLTGGTNLPPAMAFGAAGRPELAREAGRITAIEARAAGIHVTLGPVLDVNSNPLNPIINTRSFGEDPELVARLGGAWVEGARAGGLLTVGKHFPGHGTTELDSHVGLPRLAVDSATLRAREVHPFEEVMLRGMDGVLVGHLGVPALDGIGSTPASLSPFVINGLLRGDLAFDGLVVTDALNMGAITRNYSVSEASILAILAGADLLLQPPGERQVIAEIERAVVEGRIPRDRIDESARRILRAKAAAGLHREAARAAPGGRPDRSHAELSVAVSEAAVTLVRDPAGVVPLAGSQSLLHVSYAGSGSRYTGESLAAELRSTGMTIRSRSADSRSSASALSAILAQVSEVDAVLVSIALAPREYRPLALSQEFASFLRRLEGAGKPIIVVSVGSPYLLELIPDRASYLVGWTATAAGQRAVARAIVGRNRIAGRLPVGLGPSHPVGSGLDR